MRAFLLLLAGLLIAAAPVPMRLAPPDPALGVPLLLTVELPDDETTLAGLPALAPFELLAPPRRDGRELRLLLLPLRPGRHALPPLPLHSGRSRQLSTAPLTVEVVEGVAADAEPAPLKDLPQKELPSWPAILLAPLLGAAALLRRLRRRARNRPLLLEDLDAEALLAELQRRLERLEPANDGRRQALARRLEELRFAPGAATEEAARSLLADFRELREEP